jgi:hypothetical protein
MTVVAAIITRAATAHATDSLITEEQQDGTLRAQEWENPKVVRVDAFRGAMAYWGLATEKTRGWSTLPWLERMAGRAGQSSNPESFAKQAGELEDNLNKLQLPNDSTRGIGIHFTAYERVKDSWVPELFLITNWTDPSYRSVNPSGVCVTRETFTTITGIGKELCTADECQRLVVHQFLQAGRLLTFNNGDPVLFTPAASAVMTMYKILAMRGILKSPDDPAITRALAVNAIEFVCEVQGAFCREGTRRVGGRPHGLCVTPNGQYI